jgi:hypothetical protein
LLLKALLRAQAQHGLLDAVKEHGISLKKPEEAGRSKIITYYK